MPARWRPVATQPVYVTRPITDDHALAGDLDVHKPSESISPTPAEFLGLQDQAVAGWLARLIDELRPDIVYTPCIVRSGLLTAAARDWTREAFPKWIASSCGADLYPDLLSFEAERGVRHALDVADGLLPRSDREAERAIDLGFKGAMLAIVTPPPGVDSSAAARPETPSAGRRTVLVDGRHGRVDRALVVIAGLQHVASDLREYEVEVVTTNEAVRLATRLLSADAGVNVVVVSPPAASLSGRVQEAHARARVSIRMSLVGGLDWWEMAAMAHGALPILSEASDLADTFSREARALLVDPDDPVAIAGAIRRAIQDDDLVNQGATLNRAFALGHFDRRTMRARFSTAVDSIVAGN